jgi:hypothetical protein
VSRTVHAMSDSRDQRACLGYGIPDVARALDSEERRVIFVADRQELATDQFALYRVPLPNEFQKTKGRPDQYVDFFLWGIGAVGLAFVVAVLQVYTLKAADALGEAWEKEQAFLPYKLHRFFTRHLPKEDRERADEAHPVTSNAGHIWKTLSPTQQQQIGALVVQTLLDRRLAEVAASHVVSPHADPKP